MTEQRKSERCSSPGGRQAAFIHSHLGARRLFWRVYLHGLFMLLAVAGSISLLSLPFRGEGWWGTLPSRLAGWAERAGSGDTEPGPGLARAFSHLEGLVPLELTARNLEGTLLYTSIDPPLPAILDIQERLKKQAHVDLHGRGWQFVVPLRHHGQLAGALYFRFSAGSPFVTAQSLLIILGVLLVLGLVSIPLVRSIVSPIEHLTSRVRAFGTGDLSIRSGIHRNDEAGALAAAFDDMAERIQRQVRSERELLANVSHELRTPLARMKFAIELIDSNNQEKSIQYILEVRNDINELERLVEDILTSSRLSAAAGESAARALPLHLEVLQPELVSQAAVQRFRQLWPERILLLEEEPELPLIQADLTLLRRALDNLLDNARKYAAAEMPIRIGLRRGPQPDQGLVISVEDRGPGIPPEALSQLFEPFFRVDTSRQRATGGVGLGLTLVKQIVEAHQGRVEVQSTLGSGSRFSIWLPTFEGEDVQSPG